jgi:ABC-type polysaccharide/polyol phosphate transport system ATPase subunit
MSLVVDSDIYVFDESLRTENTELGNLCNERIEEIFNSRTAVVLAKTYAKVSSRFANTVILKEGRVHAHGSYESIFRIYGKEKFLSSRKSDVNQADDASGLDDDETLEFEM